MKRVAIYVRVSTARQDIEGYSIPKQKERLIAYCKAKGWVVAGMFVDPGHSGSSIERPDLLKMIDGVTAGKFDVVLVYKLDRLSRSQKDTLALIEDVFLANDVDFVSMQESFDTSTIYGRAMVGILSVFAQMERETIAERTLLGRSGRAEEGLWHGGGTDPIGYDYIDGELVINDSEAQQVRDVYAFYAMGLSVSEISRRMEGHKTKHGDWSHTSTIGNVLDNPLYAGTVHFDGVTGKGSHTPIVSEAIDKRVKALRANLRRSAGVVDSPYLLTGLIYCASCGARYFPQKRPNGRVVYSCHSRAKKSRKMVKDPKCMAPHIPIEQLDAMVEAEVLRLAEDPLIVNEIIKKETAEKSGRKAEGASEDVRRLGSEIEALMDQLTQHDSHVSVEEIAEKIAHAHAERMRLLPQSRESVPRYYDVEAAKLLLHDIRGEWADLDLRGRRMYLFQLIDKIHINTEDNVDIAWSFLRSV